MRTSNEINEIAKAVSLAQGQMKPAVFDSENPFFKKNGKNTRYASLASIMEAIRDPLACNGLSIFQDVKDADGSISITTFLLHSSGQFLEFGPCRFNPKDQSAQAYGSIISYARRYCICATLGVVAEEDDDGNQATFGKSQPQQPEIPRISKKEAEDLRKMINECHPTDKGILINMLQNVMKCSVLEDLKVNQIETFQTEVASRWSKSQEKAQ